MARYGMVMDLSRCTGCQTCVVGCQMQHNTRPGISWGSVDFVETGVWPDGERVALPHACMHCDDAPCVAACPTGASVQREDGIVTVDYEACIGCGACATACPFDARKLGTQDVRFFDAAEPAPYEAYGQQRVNVAEKCIFCADRVDAGEQPWCVSMCPQTARVFGDLDDPESDISKYIADNGAVQIPGTAIYYVTGSLAVDPQAVLMGTAGADVRVIAEPAKPAETATDTDAKDGE